MHKLYFSEMEKAYAKQYIKTNKKLIIISMIILFLCMNDFFLPGQILASILNLLLNRGFGSFEIASILQLTGCVIALAFLLPLYQFRFLMKRSSSDLYLSLPIKKERFFYVQFIMGLGVLCVTTGFVFLINLLIFDLSYSSGPYGYSSNIATNIILLIVIQLLGMCLYSFNTWICIKCNTLSDAIVVMGCYTFLPIIIHGALYKFTTDISSNVLYASEYSSTLFSKGNLSEWMWVVVGFLSVPWLMRTTLQLIERASFTNLFIQDYMANIYIINILAWIIFGIMFFFFARKIFKKRKSEESEFKTSSYLTYPFLIPMITICILIFIGIYQDRMIWLAIVFILYLIMHFFANRSLKISRQVLLKFVGMVLFIGAVQFVLVSTKMFGTIQEYPQMQDVESVEVMIRENFYSETNPPESINKLYRGEAFDQRKLDKLFEGHKELFPVSSKGYRLADSYIFTFVYQMKDNGQMYRSYNIEKDSLPLAKSLIDEWITDGIIEVASENEYSEVY